MSSPYKVPQQGQPSAAVLDEIRDLRATMTSNDRGKLSSTAFQGRDEMGELITAAFTEFLGWNGLFSFQEMLIFQSPYKFFHTFFFQPIHQTSL